MRRNFFKYSEGQWFAVPLQKGGYALGIIARGSSKTKIPLGYFFGPKYLEIPDDSATWEANPDDAIYISWFGDLYLIDGRWPRVTSTRPFYREEWPIPKFGRKDPLITSLGFIVEYGENNQGKWQPTSLTPVDANEITNLLEDKISGAGIIELRLSALLDKK